VATERLDEEKLAILRRWGEGLTRDDRDEVRAAGRAILMLSEEVERLHIELWHALDHAEAPSEAPAAETEAPSIPEPEADIGSTLRDRISAFRSWRPNPK
jgi:hypothetical protein